MALAAVGAIVIWIVGSLSLILIEWLGGIIPGQAILGAAVALFVVIVAVDWAIDERRKREYAEELRQLGIDDDQ